MKIIFLDFDGVLNSSKTTGQELEPLLVKKLNYLVDKTDALIVVTSSWRIGHDIKYLDDVLRNYGYNGFFVYGFTLTRLNSDYNRSLQIKEWLENYKYTIGNGAVAPSIHDGVGDQFTGQEFGGLDDGLVC